MNVMKRAWDSYEGSETYFESQFKRGKYSEIPNS